MGEDYRQNPSFCSEDPDYWPDNSPQHAPQRDDWGERIRLEDLKIAADINLQRLTMVRGLMGIIIIISTDSEMSRYKV